MDQLTKTSLPTTLMPPASHSAENPTSKCMPTFSSSTGDVILINAVMTILIVACGLWTYDHYFAVQPPIAVDIKGYIAEQRQLYMDNKIDNNKLRENIARLEKTISRISKHRPVIMADAVIKNVEILDP